MSRRAHQETNARRQPSAAFAFWLVVGLGAAGLCTCVGGYVILAAYAVWEGERPRSLPNGHSLTTVNDDWHSIAYPDGSRLVWLDDAVPGAFTAVIERMAVVDDVVVGTVRDGSVKPSSDRGYFIYDTATRSVRTYTDKSTWAEALTANGIDPSTRLILPSMLP